MSVDGREISPEDGSSGEERPIDAWKDAERSILGPASPVERARAVCRRGEGSGPLGGGGGKQSAEGQGASAVSESMGSQMGLWYLPSRDESKMALFGWCSCWQGRQKEEEVWLCGNRGCDQAAAQAPSPNRPQQRTYASIYDLVQSTPKALNCTRRCAHRCQPSQRHRREHLRAQGGLLSAALCFGSIPRAPCRSQFRAAAPQILRRFLARSHVPLRPASVYMETLLTLYERAPGYGQLNLSSLLTIQPALPTPRRPFPCRQ